MPWSMSGILKIHVLEIINFENFCQNLKIITFVILFVWYRSNSYQAVSNAFLMRNGQTVGYYVWVIKVYVICVRWRTQPNIFEK